MPAVELRPEENCRRLQDVVGPTQLTILLAQLCQLDLFLGGETGTATGVVFITIEDETGIANLVVWSSLFERQRRVVLSASMLACHGRVQREGDVIHVVTERLDDLSDLLKSVGGRSTPFPLRHGRGDDQRHGLHLRRRRSHQHRERRRAGRRADDHQCRRRPDLRQQH